MRVVVLAHGHPELRAGGAERAAYSVFSALKAVPNAEASFVATCAPGDIGHDGVFGAFRGRTDEFLWTPPPIDWFKLSSQDYDQLFEQCAQLVDSLRPDVVHVHHYAHTGVELFPILRTLTSARLVLSLHEFILICNNHGQMVRKQSGELCYVSSHAECARCFPEQTSGKFFLRERFIKTCIDTVDHFISPSAFLKQRFLDWGLREDRISVIENLLPARIGPPPALAPSPRREGHLRLGFFGQLTPFKGAQVLVRALSNLPAALQQRTELVIFGGNIDDWRDVRAQIEELAAGTQARIRFFGRYRNEDVAELMRSVDWVVVPSTWWENSPLVIQEAHAAGVPVLASNIGGMREKVVDGGTGRHFMAGSEFDLACKLEEIASEPAREWPVLDVSTQNEAILRAHLLIYRGREAAVHANAGDRS